MVLHQVNEVGVQILHNTSQDMIPTILMKPD